MDLLTCLYTYIEVVRQRSFAGAARHFGISRSTCTKQIAWLEQQMGAKLLNRTTKQLGLTSAGLAVLEQGNLLLQQYEQLREVVDGLAGDLAGIVRVGVPPAFGTRRILPVIRDFCAQHPQIQIALSLLTTRKQETFVEQGLDVGIIIEPELKDASYIAMPLAEARQALVASPAYLAQHGAPTSPADLQHHHCLLNTHKSPTNIWTLEGPNGVESVRIQRGLRADFGEALKDSALAGMGISMHPYYMLDEELQRGELVIVLPEYTPPSLRVYAIYSSRKHLPQRVEAFLQCLRDWASQPKSWSPAVRSDVISATDVSDREIPYSP